MTTHYAVIQALVLFCSAAFCLYGAGQPYEAYMVTASETEVYKRNQRTDFRLYRGDVVTAQPVELYDDWLNLMVDDILYQGRAGHFARLRDLNVDYGRETATYRTEIDEIDRDIASLAVRIEQLYAAEKAISFDSLVRYQYRKVVPVQVNGYSGTVPGGAARPMPTKIVYDYVDKISPSKARNQARRWEREREDLEEDLDDLQDRRRELMLRLNRADAQLAFVRWRFGSFQLGAGILRGQPYVCMQDRTPLFRREQLVQELDEDVVVFGSLNRRNDRWLKIRLQGTVYDARKKYFLSLLGVESVLGRRLTSLKERIDETEEDNDLLEARRDLLESIMLSADYRSRLSYVSLSAHPFAGGYPGSRYYSPPTCPAEAREVILRRRARSSIRDWEDELEELEDDIEDNRDDLRSWRRDLAGLEPKLEDLRARLVRQR